MNYSKQRETIYKILSGTKSHPTAEWIYEETKKVLPSVSLGTVYRNLGMLETAGLVKKVSTTLDTEHYDADVSPHAHFVCLKCGRIFDIFCDFDEVNKAATLKGFRTLSAELTATGCCPDCAHQIDTSDGLSSDNI